MAVVSEKGSKSMHLEDLDALTWSVGLVAALAARMIASDMMGVFFMLVLLVIAGVLSRVNQLPSFRHGAGHGIVGGLIAVPSALAAVGSPYFATALSVSLTFAFMFMFSKRTAPIFDWKVTPLVPAIVVLSIGHFLSVSYIMEICCVAMGLWTLTCLMKYAPGSFTLGEFFMVSILSSLPVHAIWTTKGITFFSSLFILSGVLCLTVSLVGKMPICVFVLIIPMIICVKDIIFVLKYVFELKHVLLVGYCGIVCVIFVVISIFWKGLSKFPQIIQRKFFHLMALLVFVPPVMLDYEFLKLCVSGAIFVFLVIESLRIVRFPFVASIIENYVSSYIDERDSAELILTHLFLLLGLGLPVLLTGSDTHGYLSVHICGISVLAIGDAAASIVGVKFGKHKWPGSKKSYEGTAGAFLGTWLCMLVIEQFREVNLSWKNFIATAIPAIVGALDEAFTTQIDNLTLPFVMIPFIVISKHLLR